MNLEVFEKGDFKIRVIGSVEKPLFVAKDVCETLGIKNPRSALATLREKAKGVVLTDTLETNGGKQEINVLTEQGLYLLIMQSRKPSAVDFQLWVTGEVLPSIRKTGSYQVKTLTPAEMLLETAKQIVELEKKQKEIELKADLANERLDKIETAVNFFTVIGYASRTGVRVDSKLASKIGRRASFLCKQRDIRVGEVPDPRFGKVKAYPLEVLEEVFAENRL